MCNMLNINVIYDAFDLTVGHFKLLPAVQAIQSGFSSFTRGSWD